MRFYFVENIHDVVSPYHTKAMEIQDELEKLQNQLAIVDLFTQKTTKNHFRGLILTVKKLQNIKIKIYQESSHSKPHIHIDYGRQNHTASYSIDSPSRIAGNLKNKYDNSIIDWIDNNKEKLTQLWNAVQAGEQCKELVAELKGRS